jgi:hypothetical protein
MIDLRSIEVLPQETDETILRRHAEIQQYHEHRGKCVLDDLVGFCIDRARDTYILGMPDACSFFSGKALEEALSIRFANNTNSNDIPSYHDLIEWARKESILDKTCSGIAHEVRETRNEYGHAYFKILRENLKKSPGRKPFTDKEGLVSYQKAVDVLVHMR